MIRASPETLTAAIHHFVEEFKKKGISPEQIGDGHCFEFARAVMRHFGNQENPKFHLIGTEDFCEPPHNEELDIALVKKHWGAHFPSDVPNKVWKELGGATHEWIVLDGMHYDAEAPQGVPSFVDLPFFKRWIENLRGEYLSRQGLDEAAMGGLARCTAVTLNALFAFFKKPPLKEFEVPPDSGGVLRLIDQRGLSLSPLGDVEGMTVKVFMGRFKKGAYYIGTLGHAMAVINGNLYDAAQQGEDGRVIQFAWRVSL